MKRILVTIHFVLAFIANASTQTITPLLDPNGDEVILSREEGYVIQGGNFLAIYTLNQATGMMNVMITDAEESSWLLEEEISPNGNFNGFFRITGYGFGFMADSMWYASNWTADGTKALYDEKNEQSEFTFSELYRMSDFGDRYFAAIGNYKESGLAVLLILYDQADGFVPLEAPEAIQAFELVHGNGLDPVMTVKEWDIISEEWESRKLKYWFFAGFSEIMEVPGGETTTMQSRDIDYAERTVLANTQDSVILYGSDDWDSPFTDITVTLARGEELLDVHNMVNLYGIESSVLLLIKRLAGDGSVRYYYDATNDSNDEFIEFAPIRNGDIEEVFIDGSATTLTFFYNHADTSYGFSTYEIKNNKLIKDAITKPLPHDFKIGAYDGFSTYYAYQSPQDGEFYASYFDMFQAERQTYVQSTDGKRIKNPRRFWFLDKGFEIDELICVESVVGDSVHMLVFDEDGIVSATTYVGLDDLNIHVFPNPSNDYISIQSNLEDLKDEVRYTITDSKGTLVNSGTLNNGSDTQLNVKEFVPGTYALALMHKGQVLYSTTIQIIH
jgi:Secretion system C-terminal sorting domain